jgi:hypothetical protein
VLGKLDQLMPLLQTLEIHEVITTQAVDMQRAALKRQVRDVANGARNFAMGLRRRMNALDAHDVEGRSGKPARGRSRGHRMARTNPVRTRRGGRSDGGRRQRTIAGSPRKHCVFGWRLGSMAASWRDFTVCVFR